MEFSINLYTSTISQDCPMCILRGHTLYFPKIFISLKIDFVLTNSADPDEMLHNAAFHLGLHCLPKYPFKGLRS